MGFENGGYNAAINGALINEAIHVHGASPTVSISSGTFATIYSSSPILFKGTTTLFLLTGTAYSTTGSTFGEFAIQIDSGADTVITHAVFNNSNDHEAIAGTLVLTPSAGLHTVNLRLRRTSGAGNLELNTDDTIHLDLIQV